MTSRSWAQASLVGGLFVAVGASGAFAAPGRVAALPIDVAAGVNGVWVLSQMVEVTA